MSPQRLARFGAAAAAGYFELRRFRRLDEAARSASPIPRRFVDRLLALGPLSIKLGQILSTRPDVVPKQYVAELQRLQEHVPPMPPGDVEAVIREEFQCDDVAAAFAMFEKNPVAAASVAQVHFATLKSGEEVAVKIQRRGVERAMRSDLEVVAGLLRAVRLIVPRLTRAFNLRSGFAEFRRYTLQELDFETEAHTMMLFRQNFEGWHDVVIPEPFPRYVTRRVLTMQRVAGQRVARALSPERRRILDCSPGPFATIRDRAVGKDDAERMRVATVAFRTFPFSAPSYEWRDVSSAAGVVGFDCLGWSSRNPASARDCVLPVPVKGM